MMPRSGRKGKCHNEGSECAPAQHGKRESLTKDNIPVVVEAVLNAVESRGNTNSGGECPVARSRGCQVTSGSDDTGSRHARETNSGVANDSRDDTANDTGDDTAGNTDQDVHVGEFNYVLSTIAEYRTGSTSTRDKSVFCSLANL